MLRQLVGPGSFMLCAVVITVLVPIAVSRVRQSQRAATEQVSRLIEDLEWRQKKMLGDVVSLQDRVAKTEADLRTLNHSVHFAGENERPDSTTGSKLDAALAILRDRSALTSLQKEIVQLESELQDAAKKAKQSFVDVTNAKQKHYYVKWHGKKGVQTSRKLLSELDAEVEFERVGDFAKKILMFDNVAARWVVLRTYGAEQWLRMMSNDGTIQNP